MDSMGTVPLATLTRFALTARKAPIDHWDRMFDVNAKGVFLCLKHAAKQMVEQGRGGRLVLTLSI